MCVHISVSVCSCTCTRVRSVFLCLDKRVSVEHVHMFLRIYVHPFVYSVCRCIFSCTYVRTYIRVCTTRICILMCTHVYVFVNTYMSGTVCTYAYVCVPIHDRVSVCTFLCVSTRIRACEYLDTSFCVYPCKCVCVYVCRFLCVWIWGEVRLIKYKEETRVRIVPPYRKINQVFDWSEERKGFSCNYDESKIVWRFCGPRKGVGRASSWVVSLHSPS